ncbi:metallophosphoesterase family protein [Burkholderia pseudomallei]|uniref:purple acid phosphatase family protein n=1 Tax=Burkholderia pseudomallei TaxID=28450 RepID=UPI001AD7C9F7|nr:metallophosphoesterase family protein [Burkholderia pseudomallei]MBO7774879.1 metallophosphoesterase family protein [Burkholderia pseudomallei]MBO7862394.1 metallophosphoesterase family protein [Burkholderia pseudomallei]MBO7875024.1 metallophosphoesterase family protein [Burkholderia pseudomallei]MBO7905906.1 metallophosphoesterase family protein [Burkholderia pseudomallei]
MSNKPAPDAPPAEQPCAVSRRGFLKFAGVSGLASAASGLAVTRAAAAAPDGTPEQIHLTWGDADANEVVVSWASLAAATNPRVRFAGPNEAWRTVHGVQRTYTDGLNGEVVFTYHARLRGLKPGAVYRYEVTADNDANAAQPFAARFETAPRGRAPFRWTSYGDLATPNTGWVLSSPQSRFAVQAVERFQPLFHLLNGDLCYANLNPAHQPAVWRDFGNNNQTSAANRPWMPCPGNHEIEFHNGAQGLDSYLARYTLPENGTRFAGRWYSFRVGAVLFVSLDADDVVYQDAAAFVAGPNPLVPAASTGNEAITPGTSLYVRGYSRGEQTRWLEQTLRRASRDRDIDWIVVQMHQDALSSSKTGNGSDKGIREAWLPLFDRYGVDLVLCGHDHDYERSFPVRGCNHRAGVDAATGEVVDTLQPRPVVTTDPADGRFDTSHGTIHMILGGGGTSAPLDVYGENPATGLPQARVFTKPNRPVPGAAPNTFVRHGADAVEDAIWSARRDTGTGYGIAVFDYEPGEHGGRSTITVNYYHAPGADQHPTAEYELFETIVLSKPRRA